MKPLPADDLAYVATRAQRAFDHLKDAEVMITGARGFVGSWMKDSAHFAALDTINHLGRSDGDIRSLTLSSGITHVIHCANAGSADENQADPLGVCDMIIAGTTRVAREAARVGARLLLMSSGSVYAPNAHGTYHEGDSRRLGSNSIDSAFALTKVLAEDSARSLNDNTVIARGFAMLGPRLPPQFAASEFVKAATDPRYLTVHGSGATVRSYLYAADVAAYLWHLLAFGKSGEAYNVGSDSPTTIGTLACHVAHASGLDPDRAIKWGKPSKDSPPFVPNTAKLRHLLADDWAPPLTPLESLERWIAWERSSDTPTTLSR